MLDIVSAVVLAIATRQSSLGSCDECRLSTKRLPTLTESLLTWAVSWVHL